MEMNNKTNNDQVELSIAIPFYNEEANVARVIEDMVAALQSHDIDYELILVNNGSRDRTGEIIEEYCKKDPRVKDIHLIANAGYGGGIITGLYYCTGRYIGYTWGDNQIKAEDVVSVYKMVKEKSLDWGKGYRTERYYGLQRKIISRMYNIMFKMIFRAPTQDVNGVPKVFTRECYTNMDISSTNWFIDAEIMLKSMNGPYKFGEVPLIYHRREGGSSNVNFLTVVEFIVNMIQHKWERAKENNMKKFYSSKSDSIFYKIYKIYSRLGLLQGLYTIIRMVLVPFEKIEKVIPKEGKILDLGCGNGLFSHFMYLTSKKRSIIGVDIDENRVHTAQLTVNGMKSIEFFHGDVNNIKLYDAQIITLIDLLHHLAYKDQENLLERIYKKIENQGIVIIKDLNRRPRWKYMLHYVHDTVSYKGGKLYFRSSDEMVRLLKRIGFRVQEFNIDQWNIYPHIVYRCEKRSTI